MSTMIADVDRKHSNQLAQQLIGSAEALVDVFPVVSLCR